MTDSKPAYCAKDFVHFYIPMFTNFLFIYIHLTSSHTLQTMKRVNFLTPHFPNVPHRTIVLNDGL